MPPVSPASFVRIIRAAACFLMLLFASVPVGAQEGEPDPHWAFSAFFGSGWYRISQNRTVFVLRIPPQQTLQHSSLIGGKRTLGIELHYPLSIGLNNVSDFGGLIERDNFATFSFTPGVELEIPMSEKWSLRPLVHAGWGKETDGGNSAWIYYAGIKSRYTPGDSRLDWSLLNSLYYAGHNPDEGQSDDLVSAMAGAEIRHPLSWYDSAGHQLNLDAHLTYTKLLDQAEFPSPRSLSANVNDLWEIGLALRRSGKPLRIWFIEFEHIGLAYQWSSDGDYRAITFNFHSPFRD